jgi:two-component system phosphate regulon response regulator PhoB
MRYESQAAARVRDDALPQNDEAVRVLVVDEREDVRDIVAYALRREGFVVDTAETGSAALEAARRTKPCAIVLDLTLPDMRGTALCTALREEPTLFDVGILIFSASSDDEDRISSLEVGADDYVSKPCNVRELTLRIRSLARRAWHSRLAREVLKAPHTCRWKGIELDFNRRRVTIDGAVVPMRRLELKLLATMMLSPGVVFTRGDLMRVVWGVNAQSDSRTVDTHVRRLRARLAHYGRAIETAHGVGYRWQEEDIEESMVQLRVAQRAV